MGSGQLQTELSSKRWPKKVFDFLGYRACTVIMAGAIACTILVKLYWSFYIARVREYFSWIGADLVVLLGVEFVLSLVAFSWPRKAVLRTVLLIAAVICTWSVFNAGWLLATGSQILPGVLMPLFRDPINRFAIIGHHLALRPIVAMALLGPSAIALAFLFMVLVTPFPPKSNAKGFLKRVVLYVFVVIAAAFAGRTNAQNTSESMISAPLRFNSQFKAIASIFSSKDGKIAISDYSTATRKFPVYDEVAISLTESAAAEKPKNVVVVILEGVAYRQTSFYNKKNNLTPYLIKLAEEGVLFENTMAPMTHTTKACFSILAGRFPSVSQDFVEAVPAEKPYASLATILKNELGFRTAFFQSASGDFEARPGLVGNLGFDKFWARDDLNDPNTHLGYLASDEFALLEPIKKWIKQKDEPFLLTILCSATHDPYEVPEWFGSNEAEPIERYRQTIAYTDSFIKALDEQLAELNLVEDTIFCIVGDHGEAFGEHGLFGHSRIPFEEGLRIVWLLRAPELDKAGQKIKRSGSSIDVTPTILSLLGFDTESADFDGIDMLKAPAEKDRKIYFSAWINQGPAGYILGNKKYIYDPTNNLVAVYNLRDDPNELTPKEVPDNLSVEIANEITQWRRESIIPLTQANRTGQKHLFDKWLCKWKNREPLADYDKQ